MQIGKTENIANLDDVIVVAITGSISSGKSEVCKIIANNNFPIINTDLLAKKIIDETQEVKEKIVQAFGEKSFSNNKFDNKFISGLVFGDDEISINNLIKLNSIIHPPVIEQMINQIENYAKSDYKLVFVESALIFEAGLEDGFDYIIMVDSSEEIRKDRFIKRSGLDQEQFKLRNQSQINPQFKRENSDFVIENNLSLSELEKTTQKLLEIIKFLPKREF